MPSLLVIGQRSECLLLITVHYLSHFRSDQGKQWNGELLSLWVLVTKLSTELTSTQIYDISKR